MLSHALEVISSIGLLSWLAFVISLAGILASVEDAWRSWGDRAMDRHWRRVTLTKIAALSVGAIFSLILAGSANAIRAQLQSQLDTTTQVAHSAETGVKGALTSILTLRRLTSLLGKESRDALNEANSENVKAKIIAARVAQIDKDTAHNLGQTDILANEARATSISAEHEARLAVEDASKSRVLATSAAANALASRREAVAAAVKAHVYRLPDNTIAAIGAAVSGLPKNISVYIFCNPGLEEVCHQIADTFSAAGITPAVKSPATFWSGLDADPFAKTTNPNLTVSYMTQFNRTAQLLNRAMEVAGLRSDLYAFPPNTVGPNIEINFYSAYSEP